MSTLQVPERPVFNSLDPTLEGEMSPPISRLAVIFFVLGFVALVSGLTVNALPVSILIAIGCLAVTWKLSRDKTVGGLRLAQIGLCLSVLGSCWSYTTNYLRNEFLYSQASANAKVYLDLLSQGNTFAAFELTLSEADRQITGTDLNEHYNRLLAADLPSPSMPPSAMAEPPSPQAMKDGTMKEDVSTFMKAPATLEVIAHGKDAQWEFLEGGKIKVPTNEAMRIAVVMIDKAKPDKKIEVILNRNLGGVVVAEGKPPVALWEIDQANVVKE